MIIIIIIIIFITKLLINKQKQNEIKEDMCIIKNKQTKQTTPQKK